MFFKYAVIGTAFAAGVMLFLKSKAAYFSLGWLIIVPLPLIAISLAEQPLGLLRQQPRHDHIFIYVWICIALVELFLIWIPAIGVAFRAVIGPSKLEQMQAHRGGRSGA